MTNWNEYNQWVKKVVAIPYAVRSPSAGEVEEAENADAPSVMPQVEIRRLRAQVMELELTTQGLIAEEKTVWDKHDKLAADYAALEREAVKLYERLSLDQQLVYQHLDKLPLTRAAVERAKQVIDFVRGHLTAAA